jgi:ethanolamine utilization protein EutP (predicted NTPase)
VSRLEGEYEGRVDFLAYDVAGINDDIKRQYKYIGFPQIILIDGRGEIVRSRLGYQSYDSLKADIEAVLAAP